MKKSSKIICDYLLVILIVSFLSGCGTKPDALVYSAKKPIYVSTQDVLTQGTKQQILTNNKDWEKSTNEDK